MFSPVAPEVLEVSTQLLVYVNGQFVPESADAVSALDRGLLLGDGLFETIRVTNGRALQWERHWERLCRGAQVIRLTLPWTAAAVRDAIAETLRVNRLQEAVVRLTVTRGPGNARGLLPPADTTPTLIIRATPFVPYPDHLYQDGMRVIVSRNVRRNEHSPLARIKSLNYLDNLIARQEADACGADEALLLNTQGGVAGATTANVFCVRAGRLFTPPLAAGALPGTMRALVCAELAPNACGDVRMSHLEEQALRASDEVFLTNSLLGIMPVCAIDGRPVGNGIPGRVTQELAVDYAQWLAAAK